MLQEVTTESINLCGYLYCDCMKEKQTKNPTARSTQSVPHPIGSPCVSHSVFPLQQGATW